MAAFVSTGSPKHSRRTTPSFSVLEVDVTQGRTPASRTSSANLQTSGSKGNSPIPLYSSRFSNIQSNKPMEKQNEDIVEKPDMATILNRLRLNDSRQPSLTKPKAAVSMQDDVLDKIIINLQDKTKMLKKSGQAMREASNTNYHRNPHAPNLEKASPTTCHVSSIPSSDVHLQNNTINVDAEEIYRIQRELAAAKSVITRQEQELAETRNLKHTIDQAMGPASEIDFGGHNEISEQTIGHLQSAFNASARPFTSRTGGWFPQDNSRIDQLDALPTQAYGRDRGSWGTQNGMMIIGGNAHDHYNVSPRAARYSAQPHAGLYVNTQIPAEVNFNPGRTFSGSSVGPVGYGVRLSDELNLGARRNPGQLRSNSTMSDPMSTYGSFPGTMAAMTPPVLSPIGVATQYGFPQRTVGTPIFPVATDFASASIPSAGSGWPLPTSTASAQTYVTSLEPMNYRRLLDKSVSCDWKYIVDKIVCNNDQQASIFLQQKLKVGTAEQKYEIVESIVNQAYPLMINRFGNFLVQRCFEHGTPDQVAAIADAIHGNVLSLSMDPFGCHVIQKAFDSVPESHKADMVRELLRRIPDTVIHRYACHVWQKLFELRWSGEPPQIMLKVNEALQGMWHEVALGETGSLVVQNIFENCVEEEKRPAIEEVISNIDVIAHGQFGNWCIQHLCEHASPPDKRRVIDHILINAYSYSIDQFASKVVEKCLKIGGMDFLDRYLGVITTAHPDRPRIPLIDIAGDQYGNYLIQWILTNTHQHQREQVAVHIRKHMVSLRGSKFGSRVAMLCNNASVTTRPGPPPIVNPYGPPSQGRATWTRFR